MSVLLKFSELVKSVCDNTTVTAKEFTTGSVQLLLISIRTNYTKQIVSRHVSIIFNWWQ